MTRKKQFCPNGHDTFQVGRDLSHRCLQCKAEDAAARAALEEQAVAEANAAFERRQRERDRRREQEHRRAIAAGGDIAAEARWQRLFDQTLDETGGRFQLCQWALDDGNPARARTELLTCTAPSTTASSSARSSATARPRNARRPRR
jgi:hypothetical protein